MHYMLQIQKKVVKNIQTNLQYLVGLSREQIC